jgi:hypothetical protein
LFLPPQRQDQFIKLVGQRCTSPCVGGSLTVIPSVATALLLALVPVTISKTGWSDLLWRRTVMSQQWLVEKLVMHSPANVSRQISRPRPCLQPSRRSAVSAVLRRHVLLHPRGDGDDNAKE